MTPAPKPPDLNRNPEAHLPLTTLAFHILLALADGAKHGYGIILDIEERTAGAMRLRSGTLYTAIHRLQSDTLLAESTDPSPPPPEAVDARRRYYQITPLGRRVAKLEANRLAAMLHTARDKALIDLAERL